MGLSSSLAPNIYSQQSNGSCILSIDQITALAWKLRWLLALTKEDKSPGRDPGLPSHPLCSPTLSSVLSVTFTLPCGYPAPTTWPPAWPWIKPGSLFSLLLGEYSSPWCPHSSLPCLLRVFIFKVHPSHTACYLFSLLSASFHQNLSPMRARTTIFDVCLEKYCHICKDTNFLQPIYTSIITFPSHFFF